jgi:hypothetical protein
MATALDLITSSLRLINVMASGEQVPLDMANDSLNVLNDMIDSWNTDRLAIFTTRADDFPYVLGQQSYTLGLTGDFNIARPAQIDAMSTIILNPDPANPIEIPLAMYSVENWQTQVPVKSVDGSFPLLVYDDGGFPLRTLNFWPIPTQAGNKVRIYSWQALNQPATLATTITYPPGYKQAFRFNLAVMLAAEFSAPVPPVVTTVAIESLARVKTMNAPDLQMRSDLVADPSGWNYKADLFGIGW